MSNITDKYKKEIEVNKNKMLEKYKNLVVDYENIIKEYEGAGTEPTIVQCSQIYGYNNAGVVTRWALYDLEGQNIFISDRHPKNEVYTLNLTKLDLIPNTQFYFKAIVSAGDDSVSKEILEYVPDCKQSAYYELTGTAFKTTLKFKGTVPNDL